MNIKKNKYIFGTPSYEESNQLWKGDERELDVTNEEYDKATRSLREYLWKWCPISRGLEVGYCYIRGDNYGDRTQYIELYVPELLNIEFFEYLQKWIKDYSKKEKWRIFIPTYIGEAEAIFLYENKVALGEKYQDIDLNSVLKEIAGKMRENDNKGTYEPKPESNEGVRVPWTKGTA